MKKILAVVLTLTMIFTFAACGSKTDTAKSGLEMDDYGEYTLSDYVTLADYENYDVQLNVEEVTDDNIDIEIQTRLDAAGTTEDSTEGTVDKGDTVNISFKGTLADGSTQDGMNTDSTTITLGSAGYIEGFEEGLYGHKVGDTVILDLAFPDPYELNDELSGQPVTFEVTILSKQVHVPAVLDEEFISSDSNGEAADEASYRSFIYDYLLEQAHITALFQAKNDLYDYINENSVVSEILQEKVDECCAKTYELYEVMAGLYGMTIDDFVTQSFGGDQEKFDAYVLEYAEDLINNRMIVFALAQKEGVKVTEEEYQVELDAVLTSAGASSAEDFETANGITLNDYAEMYSLFTNKTLEKTLSSILEARGIK